MFGRSKTPLAKARSSEMAAANLRGQVQVPFQRADGIGALAAYGQSASFCLTAECLTSAYDPGEFPTHGRADAARDRSTRSTKSDTSNSCVIRADLNKGPAGSSRQRKRHCVGDGTQRATCSLYRGSACLFIVGSSPPAVPRRGRFPRRATAVLSRSSA